MLSVGATENDNEITTIENIRLLSALRDSLWHERPEPYYTHRPMLLIYVKNSHISKSICC